MKVVKIRVCERCQSPGIVDRDCICVWENKYPTIELEFEQCNHCGNISETPADTEFNRIQLGEPKEKPEEEND